MAQHYLIPNSLTKRYPALTNTIWKIESLVLRFIFQLLRSLPIPLASKISGSLFKLLGIANQDQCRCRRRQQKDWSEFMIINVCL